MRIKIDSKVKKDFQPNFLAELEQSIVATPILLSKVDFMLQFKNLSPKEVQMIYIYINAHRKCCTRLMKI